MKNWITILILGASLLGGCAPGGSVARLRREAKRVDQRFINIAVAAEELPKSSPKTRILSETSAGRRGIEKVLKESEGTENKSTWLDDLWTIVTAGIVVVVVIVIVVLWLVIRSRFARLASLAVKQDWPGLIAAGRTMSGGFERGYRKQKT